MKIKIHRIAERGRSIPFKDDSEKSLDLFYLTFSSDREIPIVEKDNTYQGKVQNYLGTPQAFQRRYPGRNVPQILEESKLLDLGKEPNKSKQVTYLDEEAEATEKEISSIAVI